MPPSTDNPLVVAAYVAGLLLSVPVVVVLWKVALFLGRATAQLEQIDEIAADVKQLKEARQTEAFDFKLSLTVIESDINLLQEKAGLPVRPFPDRRVGPPDRRAS